MKEKIIICLFIIIAIIFVNIFVKDIVIKEVSGENDNFVFLDTQNQGNLEIYRFYDKETKVIYMFVNNSVYGGASGGLTVMLNQSGAPLLYK